MKYESIPAGNYIFKEGDSSNDKFYIILSGRVSVVLKSDPNVFMEENREFESELIPNRMRSQTKETKSLSSLNYEETATILQTAEKTPITLNNLDDTQVSAIRKISAVARTVARLSVIQKRKRAGDEIIETEEEHNEKIKQEVNHLKEAGKNAIQCEKGSFKDLDPETTPQIGRKGSRKRRTHNLNPEIGVINKELREGECFGERALGSKEAKRMASILTNTDCEFIILLKKDYLNIMSQYNKENRLKLEFLKKHLPYVDKIVSASVLQDYSYIFQTEFLTRGNIVVQEGQDGERIYILVQGQISLQKKIDYENPLRKKKTSKTVLISNSCTPTIFGEEILFEPKFRRKYKYTVKVMSNPLAIELTGYTLF